MTPNPERAFTRTAKPKSFPSLGYVRRDAQAVLLLFAPHHHVAQICNLLVSAGIVTAHANSRKPLLTAEPRRGRTATKTQCPTNRKGAINAEKQETYISRNLAKSARFSGIALRWTQRFLLAIHLCTAIVHRVSAVNHPRSVKYKRARPKAIPYQSISHFLTGHPCATAS
jgi:hypothetical protein